MNGKGGANSSKKWDIYHPKKHHIALSLVSLFQQEGFESCYYAI